MMTERFAVIGNPISHSLSPLIHHTFARQTGKILTYEKILAEEDDFEEKVSTFFNTGGKGLNITLPFKERAFFMSRVPSKRSVLAKAANTLWRRNNQLYADNTDGVGLLNDLAHHINLANKHVLILGAGGAARGIIGPLFSSGVASLTIANRSEVRREALLREFSHINAVSIYELSGEFDLMINATSAFLLGDVISLPKKIWQNKPFCYDLSYVLQKETPFMQIASAFGCVAVDGLGMLVEQAAEAFLLWHGIRPETSHVLAMINHQKIL